MILGFSTGILYRTHDRHTQKVLNAISFPKTKAIELMCRDEKDLDIVYSFPKDHYKNFEYVSLHAPQRDYAKKEYWSWLEKMEKICEKFSIKNIVLHPDEVSEWRIFKKFTHLPISIENMDDRKQRCRDIEDLEKIFDIADVALTIDIQHCFTNDSSMELARKLHKKFKERIVQYHVSGYEDGLLHVPLFRTNQDVILGAMELPHLPMIIESTMDSFEDIPKEFQFIHSFFEKNFLFF